MNNEIEKIKKITDKIDGWTTLKERKLLYNLAKNCAGKGVIVEIGSCKGRSTVCLGTGLRKGKIYSIDPFVKDYNLEPDSDLYFHKVIKDRTLFGSNLEEFKKNIREAEFDDVVVIPIVDLSETVAQGFNEPVELIFIDGGHDYDYVKQDFELWFPKVIDGGIMAFHDTNRWPGPKKVVEEFIYKSKNFRNVGFVDSITFAEKVKQNSVKDRLRNRYILLLKNIYTSTAKLNLPSPIRRIGKKLLTLIK
ncbi:MAG: class I SAM-dependent methyltransferase [Nanoarchaeota archaeon]|nr:class I SAM-dependent methyltransferase [Nanoarchaeota archaeon]